MFYCDKCGKPATNLTWVEINGRRMEQHLCSECALYSDDFDDFEDFVQPAVGEFFDFPVAFARRKPSKHVPTCLTCGFTRDDFLQSGKFNCQDCYKYLGEIAEPDFSKSTSNKFSFDKVKLKPKAKPQTKLELLKANLDRAVKEERYEDASEIKKEIDKLEKENNI